MNAFEWVGIGLAATELHIVVHEAGHALAGAALGFRVYAIDTGLFHLRLRPRFRLGPQTRVPLIFGGFTRTTPPPGVGRGRQALLVLGGPALSLLSGSICLAAAHRPGGSWSLSTGRWALLSYAIAALAGSLFTLIPRWTTRLRLPSDGALLVALLRGEGPRPRPSWVNRLRIQSSMGLRPRETDVSADEALSTSLFDPITDSGEQLVLAAAVALDSPAPQRARPAIERALAAAGGDALANARDIFHLAALYFALIEPDLPRAKGYLERLADQEGDPEFRLLAEAAVAAPAAPARSEALLEAWQRWTQSGGIPGFRRAGNDWAVERLTAAFARRKTGPGAPSTPG